MYIFLDIGGTYTKIASSKNLKNLDNFKHFKTSQNYIKAKKEIKEEIIKISGNKKIKAIVIAIAGMIDYKKKQIIFCPNLKDWSKKPLLNFLKKNFNSKVYLFNDADLAALGETSYLRSNIIAYLSLGTGVGGTRIVNRKIDLNNFGFEPGHQIIDKGRSFEDLVGNKNIKKCKNNLEEWHKNLSIGLLNTSLLWSPELIILGGGLSHKYLSLKLLKSKLEKHFLFQKIKIIKSKYKNKSALYGAMYYLKNK